MKHIEIRRHSNRDLQYFATAVSIYLFYSLLTGEIFELRYLESKFISLDSDPEDFWTTVLIYSAGCIWMFFYSIIGFPVLEKYFTNAQIKQTEKLNSRTIKQQLVLYILAPAITFTIIMGLFIYFGG